MGIYIADCKLVISMYTSVIDTFREKLDDESCTALLKTLTGIMDYFMSGKHKDVVNDLIILLLDSIFGVYTRSSMQNTDFFDTFFTRWCSHDAPLKLWFKLTRACTIRVIEVMCDTKHENSSVDRSKGNSAGGAKENPLTTLEENENYNIISLPNEHLIYLWFKLLTIFGRESVKNNYKLQENQARYLMEIIDLIHTWSDYKTKAVLTGVKPDTKTKFRFAVSATLKEAVANLLQHQIKTLRLKGLNFIAESFDANMLGAYVPYLLNFLYQYPGSYKNLKLALFYNKIMNYYKKLYAAPDTSQIKEIVKSNSRICSSTHNGINLLISPFLKVLDHFVKADHYTLPSQPELLLKVLLKVSALTASCQTRHRGLVDKAEFVDTWALSREYLDNVIGNYLYGKFNETLYWLASIHVVQHYSSEKKFEFLTIFIQRGFSFINSASLLEGNTNEILSVLEIAETLANSFGHFTPNTTALVQYLVDVIDKSVTNDKSLIKKSKSGAFRDYERTVCGMLRLCLLLGNVSTAFSYTSLIEQLREIVGKYRKAYKERDSKNTNCKMMDFAQGVLDAFRANNRKDYGSVRGLSNSSTVFSSGEAEGKTMSYLEGDKVVTVKQLVGDELLITVRDALGVFSYKAQTINQVDAHKKSRSLLDNGIEPVNDQPPELLEFDSARSAFKDLPRPENLDSIASHIKLEEEFIEAKSKRIRKVPVQKKSLQLAKTRMFFQHFKMLDKNSISLIESEKLSKLIQNLDLVTFKQRICITFLYITEGERLINNKAYERDDKLMAFISDLGIMLDEDKVKTGNFEDVKNYVKGIGVVYCADYFYELLFLCPFILFTQKIAVNISNIYVMWNAQGKAMEKEKVVEHVRKISKASINSVAIVITPVKNGLFLINMLGIVGKTGFYRKLAG